MAESRIPFQFERLVPYLQLTDNYQLADDPDNPGNPRFKKWKWEITDSAAWTDFRDRADVLFIDYDAENLVNKNTRDKVKTLIREVQEYDHDRDTGHKLLDKVAMYGNIDDCNTFRVKRGTVLEDETSTRTGDLGMLVPVISIRQNKAGEQELSVTNPDTPDSSGLPEGVSHALVFRCVTDSATPPALSGSYDIVGASKRGIFVSNLSGITLDPTKKNYAHYIARYISKTGQVGNASVAVKAMIME
jgi:hypothetical protein